MKVFLEVMKRVAEWFENEAYHGAVATGTDYGIIAVAALFEEHCHKRAQPFAYQDAKNIGEDRREWCFNETWSVSLPPTNSPNGATSSWNLTVSSTLLQPPLPTQCRMLIAHST